MTIINGHGIKRCITFQYLHSRVINSMEQTTRTGLMILHPIRDVQVSYLGRKSNSPV